MPQLAQPDPLEEALKAFDQKDRERIVNDGLEQLNKYRGRGTFKEIANLPSVSLPGTTGPVAGGQSTPTVPGGAAATCQASEIARQVEAACEAMQEQQRAWLRRVFDQLQELGATQEQILAVVARGRAHAIGAKKARR